jgi:hypothetical protein
MSARAVAIAPPAGELANLYHELKVLLARRDEAAAALAEIRAAISALNFARWRGHWDGQEFSQMAARRRTAAKVVQNLDIQIAANTRSRAALLQVTKSKSHRRKYVW